MPPAIDRHWNISESEREVLCDSWLSCEGYKPSCYKEKQNPQFNMSVWVYLGLTLPVFIVFEALFIRWHSQHPCGSLTTVLPIVNGPTDGKGWGRNPAFPSFTLCAFTSVTLQKQQDLSPAQPDGHKFATCRAMIRACLGLVLSTRSLSSHLWSKCNTACLHLTAVLRTAFHRSTIMDAG